MPSDGPCRLHGALTYRTKLLANILGPCGLLDDDSGLDLPGQESTGCDQEGTPNLQSQLADPHHTPPQRMKDVPPVSQWDRRWREWALCVGMKGERDMEQMKLMRPAVLSAWLWLVAHLPGCQCAHEHAAPSMPYACMQPCLQPFQCICPCKHPRSQCLTVSPPLLAPFTSGQLQQKHRGSLAQGSRTYPSCFARRSCMALALSPIRSWQEWSRMQVWRTWAAASMHACMQGPPVFSPPCNKQGGLKTAVQAGRGGYVRQPSRPDAMRTVYEQKGWQLTLKPLDLLLHLAACPHSPGHRGVLHTPHPHT